VEENEDFNSESNNNTDEQFAEDSVEDKGAVKVVDTKEI